MSNEVLLLIPDKTWEVFKDFDDDCIVEVFRLWDCYSKTWHDGTTMVFRFESNDIFTWCTDMDLQTKVGAVNTFRVSDDIYNTLGLSKDEFCLCWMPDSEYQKYLGEDHQGEELLNSFG